MRDLLRLQRVNRIWRQYMKRSPQLRRILYLEQISKPVIHNRAVAEKVYKDSREQGSEDSLMMIVPYGSYIMLNPRLHFEARCALSSVTLEQAWSRTRIALGDINPLLPLRTLLKHEDPTTLNSPFLKQYLTQPPCKIALLWCYAPWMWYEFEDDDEFALPALAESDDAPQQGDSGEARDPEERFYEPKTYESNETIATIYNPKRITLYDVVDIMRKIWPAQGRHSGLRSLARFLEHTVLRLDVAAEYREYFTGNTPLKDPQAS